MINVSVEWLKLAVVFWLLSVQVVTAEESLNEFECLHLNIGLLSLLETENTYFQRKQNQQFDEAGGIAKGLSMLKNRGESCKIYQVLYIEAAEYSLHFRKLEYAEYFIVKARLSAKNTKVRNIKSK